MSISSPCIGVCLIDESSRLCAGCGRTLDEIGSWRTMSEAARTELMARLPERLAAGREPAEPVGPDRTELR